MKLTDHFEYFLTETVNLNQTRIDQLDSRLSAIETYLRGHDEIGPVLLEVIPQGSYAHRTIIKPVGTHEFDADALLRMTLQESWQPCEYTRRVCAAFRDSATYKDMAGRRTRSVEIKYANDCHLDLVPYLDLDSGHWITNHKVNEFEETNPEGFSAWLENRDEITGGRLVEVIRLMKYLRDFKQTFTIPSFILSMLLAEQVNKMQLILKPDAYEDLPTALVTILADLDGWLQARPLMPVLVDPSCGSSTFNHRWDEDLYRTFRDKIHLYVGWATEAYEETEEAASVTAWQKLFGDKFKQPPETQVLEASARQVTPPSEEFIENRFPLAVDHRFKLKVTGRVQKLPGTHTDTYDLAKRGDRVSKNREIIFSIVECTVPNPDAFYWKVRNHGAEAAEREQLRGEITQDSGERKKRETTSYKGSHYVECYAVKDGRVVAVNRQRVLIP
jgi:hypothetical protein